MFGKLKAIFGGKPPQSQVRKQAQVPEVAWVPAEKNRWNIPVLDVRPVTQGMISASNDPKCAANAVSYSRDDGSGFARDQPDVQRSITANLSYRIDRLLAPGV